MARHPEQPSEAQRFCLRAALAFLIFSAALYLGGAFLTLDWDFRDWSLEVRTSLAAMDLFFGGVVALAAGASALRGA